MENNMYQASWRQTQLRREQWVETAKGDQTKGSQIFDELIVTKDTAEL